MLGKKYLHRNVCRIGAVAFVKHTAVLQDGTSILCLSHHNITVR